MAKPQHRMLHTAQLKSAGYDEKEKVLEIAFHNGQLKSYKGVPHEVARRLFAAGAAILAVLSALLSLLWFNRVL